MARESTWLERPRVLWAWALGVSFLLSVLAVFRGGYIGPDYNTHLAHILGPKVFDFSLADPPIYILMAKGLFKLIGRNNGFPITLSIIQAAINVLALWWFFLYSQRHFKSPVLHLAFVFFLIFLPVRIIHAVCIGTDWMVVPVFVLVLYLFDKFLSEETSTLKNAAFLGLGLALGIWCKYSFMALLPPVFVVFAVLWWRRSWSLKRFVTICALSLVLPSALVVYSYWGSRDATHAIAKRIWLPKGIAAEMDYKDLFLLKKADLQLFKAPEMFTPEPEDEGQYHYGYRVAHRHSYLALSHMSTFTDTQNIFQDLPVAQEVGAHLIPDQHRRAAWKTPVNVASMALGTLWTVLALIGTPWLLFRALRHLWKDKLERVDITALLGTAYFLLMFLPIPLLFSSVVWGYWTPRLILPSLFFFFWAAFLLLDRTIVKRSERIAFDVLTLVIIQCGIEIVILA
jgi:4-amino-4-deoxy-L-arabinose transferase-like glycosyltransferase